MPYFLSDKNLVLGTEIEMSGEEARHVLLSHRIKKGEKIKLQGPDGKRFLAEVLSASKKDLSAKILENLPVPAEPVVAITLFQSVVSEKALDFIFQKGTELGLNKIVLFNSANTATKISSDLFKKKRERWNKILIEAAKQSERAKWPELEFAVSVDQALEKMRSIDKIFLADISGSKISTLNPKPLPTGQAGSTLGLIIGPEGGFAENEIGQFKSLSNLESISLGPILLRADTAALASLAILRNI